MHFIAGLVRLRSGHMLNRSNLSWLFFSNLGLRSSFQRPLPLLLSPLPTCQSTFLGSFLPCLLCPGSLLISIKLLLTNRSNRWTARNYGTPTNARVGLGQNGTLCLGDRQFPVIRWDT